MRQLLIAIVGVLLLSVDSRADDKPLPTQEWEKDRKKLIGEWHTDPKAAVQFHFGFFGREDKSSEATITLSAKPDHPHKVVFDRAYHSPKDEKQRYFFAPRSLKSSLSSPPIYYRFEEETLILKVDEEGDLKGEHRLYRMRRVGSAVRPLGHALGIAELKALEGKWATDPKKPVQWEIAVKLVEAEKTTIGGQVSFNVGVEPRLKFGCPLTSAAFWASPSGKRRFLILDGLDPAGLNLFEYHINGDELIVSVPEGRAEGIHKLHRVK